MKGMSVLFTGIVCLATVLACKLVPVERPVAAADNLPQTQMMGIPSGAPLRIVAETIDLDAPVAMMGWYLKREWGQVVSEWDVPTEDAAWHANSAKPGDGSNIVISGHNNSMGGRVFANLEGLDIGHQITLWNNQGETFTYQVHEKKLIRTLGASAETFEFLQEVIEPTAQEQLTLITCWPGWSNTHRLIIIAGPYPNEVSPEGNSF